VPASDVDLDGRFIAALREAWRAIDALTLVMPRLVRVAASKEVSERDAEAPDSAPFHSFRGLRGRREESGNTVETNIVCLLARV
jgi:hypothetical protein